ncbi:hypothetical protein IJJ97_03300 [bacterium]|nr:hypothetical protein [bacterium]
MLFTKEYTNKLDCFVKYNNKVKKYLDIRNPQNIDKLDKRVRAIQSKFSDLDPYNIRKIYPNTNDFPEITENKNYIFSFKFEDYTWLKIIISVIVIFIAYNIINTIINDANLVPLYIITFMIVASIYLYRDWKILRDGFEIISTEKQKCIKIYKNSKIIKKIKIKKYIRAIIIPNNKSTDNYEKFQLHIYNFKTKETIKIFGFHSLLTALYVAHKIDLIILKAIKK